MYYFLYLLLCSIFTHIIAKFSINILSKYDIVDYPGERRPHVRATPSGGGLAIMLILIPAILIFNSLMNLQLDYTSYIIASILIVLSIVTFYDDIYDSAITVRLITYLLVCIFAVHTFIYPKLLFQGYLPLYIDFIIVFVLLCGFVNVYNFLDGIDGITCVQILHHGLAILILCYINYEKIIHVKSIILLISTLLACTLGFMPLNWPPAKIFIGDIGTINIGFIIGLALLIIGSTNFHLMVSCLIIGMYSTLDGAGTIILRVTKGERFWLPHLNHYFQQAVRKGMSHREIVGKIALCNAILMILAISAMWYPKVSLILSILITLILLYHFQEKSINVR